METKREQVLAALRHEEGTVPSWTMAFFNIETARRLLGEENVVTDRPLSLGGDDFAELQLRVPGVYAYIGTRNAALPDTTVAHHNGRFDIDEDCLPLAAGD